MAYTRCMKCDAPLWRITPEEIAGTSDHYPKVSCPHCGTVRHDSNVDEMLRVLAQEIIDIKAAQKDGDTQ